MPSDQWAWLIGGKITAAEEKPDEFDARGSIVELEVTFTKPRTVKCYREEIPNVLSVKLEVWSDEEGNGAGELVLTETMQLVPDEPATIRES